MKLISLNTWGGKLFEPLIEFIKENASDTDIFCFQEVFSTTSNHQTEMGFRLNLYQKLQKILPNHNSFFDPCLDNYIAGSFQKNLVDFNLSWGQVTFVSKQFTVASQGDFFVYGSKDSFNPEYENTVPRNVQFLSFVTAGERYTVCNLHGIWVRGPKIDIPARIKQSERIKTFLDQQKGERILVGDFNLDMNTQSIRILEENLVNLVKEYKIPTTRSKHYDKTDDKFADYTFVSNDVKVKSFKVPEIEISDHLPMILEFS